MATTQLRRQGREWISRNGAADATEFGKGDDDDDRGSGLYLRFLNFDPDMEPRFHTDHPKMNQLQREIYPPTSSPFFS